MVITYFFRRTVGGHMACRAKERARERDLRTVPASEDVIRPNTPPKKVVEISI